MADEQLIKLYSDYETKALMRELRADQDEQSPKSRAILEILARRGLEHEQLEALSEHIDAEIEQKRRSRRYSWELALMLFLAGGVPFNSHPSGWVLMYRMVSELISPPPPTPPATTQELLDRANDSFDAGRYEQTIATIQARAAAQPNQSGPNLLAGLAYLREGKRAEAQKYLRAGLLAFRWTDPPEVRLNAARARLALGDRYVAHRLTESALKEFKEDDNQYGVLKAQALLRRIRTQKPLTNKTP